MATLLHGRPLRPQFIIANMVLHQHTQQQYADNDEQAAKFAVGTTPCQPI